MENSTKHPLYWRWQNMVSRCHHSANPSFSNYGGRGIRVCDRWRYSFDAFVEDVGTPPPGYTLDRIDNDKDYLPDNVRWASRHEQNVNKRNSIRVELDGKLFTLFEIAEMAGRVERCIRSRWNRGDLTPRQIAGLDPLPVKKRSSTPAMRTYWASKGAKTHCKHGHEYTPENTLISEQDGSRICRECRKRIDRESRKRRRG